MNVLTNYNAKSKVRYITKESLAFRIENICKTAAFLEMKFLCL